MPDWESLIHKDPNNLPHFGVNKVDSMFEVKGNIPLPDARLVFLGDTHHENVGIGLSISQFLTTEVKNGDVVLLEGTESGKKVDTTSNMLLNKLGSGATIIGWDDMQAHQKGDRLYNQLDQLRREYDVATSNVEKIVLGEKYSQLQKTIKEVVIEKRNLSLTKTLKSLKLDDPNTKIRCFVVLGENHLTKDIQEFSDNIPHVILSPKPQF